MLVVRYTTPTGTDQLVSDGRSFAKCDSDSFGGPDSSLDLLQESCRVVIGCDLTLDLIQDPAGDWHLQQVGGFSIFFSVDQPFLGELVLSLSLFFGRNTAIVLPIGRHLCRFLGPHSKGCFVTHGMLLCIRALSWTDFIPGVSPFNLCVGRCMSNS